jgi:hypothetical protein
LSTTSDQGTKKRGGCRHNVQRVTYDRSERYARLGERRPKPRFGVRSRQVDAYVDAFLNEREAIELSPEILRSYISNLGVVSSWLRAEKLLLDPAEWDAHLLRLRCVSPAQAESESVWAKQCNDCSLIHLASPRVPTLARD